MTTLEKKIIKRNLDNRYFEKASEYTTDDARKLVTAVLVGPEARRGWCGAIMGIVLLAVAVWGVIGLVLS